LIFRPKLTKLWLNTTKWCGEWSQIWDYTWKAVNTSTSKTYATKYTAASYLITFDDDEDPGKTTKAIEEFILANMIPNKRISELTSGGSLVGAYKLSGPDTITPILLLSRVSLTDATRDDCKKLLGQGTNDAAEFRPKLLELTAADNVFIVTTETSPPSLFKKNVGAPFELKEIETTVSKLFDALKTRSGTTFAIAALSGLLPFGKREQSLHCGRVVDTTGDDIDNSVPGGSYWLRGLLLFDKAVQDAIVKSIAADPKILGKRAPKITKVSCKIKSTATPIHPVQFADCDSDELAQPTEELRQQIAVILGKLASECYVPNNIATPNFHHGIG
jgi:hypothetical protein